MSADYVIEPKSLAYIKCDAKNQKFILTLMEFIFRLLVVISNLAPSNLKIVPQ